MFLKEASKKYYFSDRPCARGHLSVRYKSSRGCKECSLINEIKSRKGRQEARAGRPRSASCEICGKYGKIVFDHDHDSDVFRGWICSRCNFVLGEVGDSQELLMKLVEYINKSSQFASPALKAKIDAKANKKLK